MDRRRQRRPGGRAAGAVGALHPGEAGLRRPRDGGELVPGPTGRVRGRRATGAVFCAPVPESDGRGGDAAAGDGRGGGRGVPDAIVRAVRLTGCIARRTTYYGPYNLVLSPSIR